jgi:glycosyltransferase 2 family protein
MTSRTDSPGSSTRVLKWALALLFAAVLLYFSLHGIQWPGVWQILAHANLALLALSMGISSASLFLRGLRWRVLLCAAAPIAVSTAFWAVCAGYLGNNFLPARAGEIIRSLMISSASGLSRTFVLTTALGERMCDALSLVLVSSVVLLSLPVKPGWFAHAATPFAVLGLCGAASIIVLPRAEHVCQRCFNLIPVPQSMKAKLSGIMEQFLGGMRSFHNRNRLFIFIGLTAAIWTCDAVGVLLTMRALALPGTLSIALLLMTGLGLGSALPSTPGYVGIYQFIAVSVLTPFGFSKTAAIAYILLAQALQYVLFTFWGTIGLVRSRGLRLTARGTRST